MAVATPALAGTDTTDNQTPKNYLNASKGLLSWLFTLDHKRIGVMYLVAILSSFFLGGVFALLYSVWRLSYSAFRRRPLPATTSL